MPSPGSHNDLTDVPGLKVGCHGDPAAMSGCTVVLCPTEGAVAGVDVRGSAPGTRETDLLNPINLVERVHAVVLSGGSAYGLACCDGVVRWLGEQGLGFPLDDQGHVAPIVPGAVLFDLGRGAEFVPPISPDWGRAACEAANEGPIALGCVGAGTGAVAGGVKGGLGSASEALDSGVMVGPWWRSTPWAPCWTRPRADFGRSAWRWGESSGPSARPRCCPPGRPSRPRTPPSRWWPLTRLWTRPNAPRWPRWPRTAWPEPSGRPHTMFDGDTVFALSTHGQPLPPAPVLFGPPAATALSEIGRAAADCLSRAIIRAVLAAESLGGWPSFTDLTNR